MFMWLDLGLEDGVDGVYELGADLRREVHGHRGVLDRGDRLGGVGELAGGELLGGGGGVGLRLLERVDRAGQGATEAAVAGARGSVHRRGGILPNRADRADAPLARAD